MAKIKDLIEYIEEFAPLSLQGDFDNCGLKTGNTEQEATGVMVTLDTNVSVVEDAIQNKCNLIIEHHPSIFHSLKQLDSRLPLIQAITLAIKNDIVIYSAHTNIDFCKDGLNDFVAKQMGLENIRLCGDISEPRIGELKTSVTLMEYAETLKKIFNDKNIKTIGDTNKKISKVAVINGGGGSSEQDVLCAYYAGADVYATSSRYTSVP